VVDVLTEELGSLVGKTIAVWGISFKPDSDDIRDSPALDIAESLARSGATVVSADPEGWKPAQARVERAGLSASLTTTFDHRAAVTGADAVVIATEWKVFQNEAPGAIGDLMTQRIVVDGRNCLNVTAWKEAGFRYRGMGRA
jgi:UDPglucose 6-dehydrogenase